MKAKKILLSAQFLEPGLGGICTLARMTAAVLEKEFDVTALACQDTADHMMGTVPVRAFKNNRAAFVFANTMALGKCTHVFYDFVGTARAHLNLPFRSRPYALWAHGVELWKSPSSDRLRALEGASLVLVNSADTHRRIETILPKSAAVEICELGSPDTETPVELNYLSGRPTVMLLGRADEALAKGHDLLIQVWPKVVEAVPDAMLLLVGGGPMLGHVRSLVQASPARGSIEVAGFVANDRLESYWRRTTVFAMPALEEGFGLVYVDAMQRGIPVIASCEDAGQEVNVDGVTGYNVSRDHAGRLTDVIVELLRNRDRALELGRNGHARWQQHYTFEAFAARFRKKTAGFLQ